MKASIIKLETTEEKATAIAAIMGIEWDIASEDAGQTWDISKWNEDKKTFWLEDFEGESRRGYFVRNALKESFELLEKDGKKPVAIIFDGTWNLEIAFIDK